MFDQFDISISIYFHVKTKINKKMHFLRENNRNKDKSSISSLFYMSRFSKRISVFSKTCIFTKKQSYAYFHEKKNAFILRKYSNQKIVKIHENEEYQFYIPTTIG